MEVFYVFALYKLCALSPVVIVYDENDNFHCLPVTHSIMCLIFIAVYGGNSRIPTIVAIPALLMRVAWRMCIVYCVFFTTITRIWTGSLASLLVWARDVKVTHSVVCRLDLCVHNNDQRSIVLLVVQRNTFSGRYAAHNETAHT